MKISVSRSMLLIFALLVAGGYQARLEAQTIFFDDFEDRVKDQPLIGNNWTWFDQTYGGNTCTGSPTGEFGPFSDGDPSDYPADNRNYWTASADVGAGDSYYRAGLEVPAWDGALGNMLRVYGNQYNGATSCERVLVFKEETIGASGPHTFSFEVAKDQFGAPANGEITAAFVKVLRSSNNSFATLSFETVLTAPPPATSPSNVSTRFQYIEFDVPPEWVGELLQFGFYNDLAENLGQSWATSAALYDNVKLAASETGAAEYIVTTDWFVAEPELLGEDLTIEATVSCATPITGFSLDNGTDPVSVSDYEIVVLLNDGDSVTVDVETVNGATQCSAAQNVPQSGAEKSASAACNGQILLDDESATCTFDNTLFFEGVPTLGRAGTAILALLMLGLGLAGFRRFV
ncbi:MAG: hypothetical protein HKN57_03335 [Xanthomonadales bacterium]|nr:hypothetical protein [Gammaproteobacteria bacterium]MBT8054525.1 hypothetical protein [Gammaproteobacteria bacterium]NND56261.1 hypothetical protein [Xanthomonadales bacterium]NNK52336.1 hypothetical protein [Xanthomonadales bacterium]